MKNNFAQPQFVVAGGQYNDGVILLASDKVSYIELEEELSHIMRCYNFGIPPKYDIHLTSKILDYVVIQADTYSHAWQELFRIWSPQTISTPGIAAIRGEQRNNNTQQERSESA